MNIIKKTMTKNSHQKDVLNFCDDLQRIHDEHELMDCSDLS